MTDTLPAAALPEIQALLFRGWKKLPHAAYVFVRFPDDVVEARGWLARRSADVAWAAGPSADRLAVAGGAVPGRLQLGLTAGGLRRLGVPEAVLDRFPQEVKLGMEHRARVLGDPPGDRQLDLRAADALLIVYGEDAAGLDALLDAQRAGIERRGGAVIAVERAAAWRPLEPFGYADGVSQPLVKGQPNPRSVLPAPHNAIDAGEFVLGYHNEYGQLPRSPTFERGDGLGDAFDLGKNGSYLVFRKLEQDVATFWQTFRRLGEQHRGARVGPGDATLPVDARAAAHWLAARAMGRWPNGNASHTCPHAPGARQPDAELNAFTFADDPHGAGCPIGSHVRRVNPRDARGGATNASWRVVQRHRIIRRGRAYGEPLTPEEAMDGKTLAAPSGLLFVCLQANIARGFEFVQQIWSQNPGFHGLHQESDPIAGPGGPFTIPAEPVRIRVTLPRFVIPRGGGYFFVPSRAALAALSRLGTP